MPRILIAWELGHGLGHVGRLTPIARELKGRGQECVFAVRALGPFVAGLNREGFRVVQAPFLQPQQAQGVMASLGDVLATIGFRDPNRLEPYVRGWDDLLSGFGIDLVVADYAPVLCLAALGRHRVVAIGDAFTLPPVSGANFPTFQPDGKRLVEEAEMVAAIAEVQRRRGAPAPATLPGIFAEAERFIVTLPELGHRSEEEQGTRIVGPIAPLPAPASEAPSVDFFAYLAADAPNIDRALAVLKDSRLKGELFLRDGPRAQREKLTRPGLVVHDGPQPLEQAIGRARVLIHHGGLGTSEAGLAVGRPQLLVPRHQEQAMNAAALRALGVAVQMRSAGRYDAKSFQAALTHVHGEAKFAQAAQQRAEAIAARGSSDGLKAVVSACLRRIG